MFEGVERNRLNVHALLGEPMRHTFGTGFDAQPDDNDAGRTKQLCLIFRELFRVPIVKVVEPALYPSGLMV